MLLKFSPMPAQLHVPSNTEFSLALFYTHGMSQASGTAAHVQQPVLQLLQRGPASASPLGRAVIMSCAPVMQELVAQAHASVCAADVPDQKAPVAPQPLEPSCCNSAPLSQDAAPQSGLLELPANACAEAMRMEELVAEWRVSASAVMPLPPTAATAVQCRPAVAAPAPGAHTAAPCDLPTWPRACGVPRQEGKSGTVAALCKRPRPATLDPVRDCDTPPAPQRACLDAKANDARATGFPCREAAQAGQAANVLQPERRRHIGSAGKPTTVTGAAAHPERASAVVQSNAGMPDMSQCEPSRIANTQTLCAVAHIVQRAARHNEAGRASDSEWEPSQGGESRAVSASAMPDYYDPGTEVSLRSSDDAARGHMHNGDSRECTQRGPPRLCMLPVRVAAAPHAGGSELDVCRRQSAQPVAELRASVRTESTGGSGDAARACNLCNMVKPRTAMLKTGRNRCKECEGKLQKLRRSGYSTADGTAALQDGSGDKVSARRKDNSVREQHVLGLWRPRS